MYLIISDNQKQLLWYGDIQMNVNKYLILTHLAYIANGKKTCYIVQQFHWANKRDVTLRHL